MVKKLALLLPAVLLAAVLVSLTGAGGKIEHENAGSPPKPVVDSPQIPPDVSIPAGFSGNPIAFFDDYSWRAFIAVVWPGLKNRQGVPDAKQTVDGTGPRVFETYKSLEEVFHSDGSAPTPLDIYDAPIYNACGVQAAYGDVTLGSFSKFSALGQAGFGTLVGPLVAQNTTYVRYLTGYNNTGFQQILGKKWYLRSNLPNPPKTITFENGSVNVKSAWIEMAGIPHPEHPPFQQASSRKVPQKPFVSTNQAQVWE